MEGVLSVALIAALLVIGIILCFAGLKFLKGLIAVYLFVSAFLFIYNLFSQSFPEFAASWVVALIAALILALLAAFFIKFCIFITGGLAGLLLYFFFSTASPLMLGSGISSFLYGALFFVIGGVLAMLIKKHLVIFFTAFIGAQTIVQSAGMLIGVIMNSSILKVITLSTAIPALRGVSIFSHASKAGYILPVVVLIIAGVITQYKFTAKRLKYKF